MEPYSLTLQYDFETIKYADIYQIIKLLLKAFFSFRIAIFHHLYRLDLFTAEIPIFTLWQKSDFDSSLREKSLKINPLVWTVRLVLCQVR